MTPTLEKVARALYEAWLAQPDTQREARHGGPFPAWPRCDTAYWLASARAALLAIREPSEEMMGAYFARCDLGGDLTEDPADGRHPAYGAFTAMIDVVLGAETASRVVRP